GGHVAAPSDVYSLGLVLLEALTGRPAFGGTDPEAAAARVVAPPAIPGALGTAWCAVLTAMTTVDPAQRCEAAWVAEQLSDLAELPGIVAPPSATAPLVPEPTTTPMPEPTAPAPVSSRRGIVAALLAA